APQPVSPAVAVEIALSDDRPCGELRAHPCHGLDRSTVHEPHRHVALSIAPGDVALAVTIEVVGISDEALEGADGVRRSVTEPQGRIWSGREQSRGGGEGGNQVFRIEPLLREAADSARPPKYVLRGEPQPALGTRDNTDRLEAPAARQRKLRHR